MCIFFSSFDVTQHNFLMFKDFPNLANSKFCTAFELSETIKFFKNKNANETYYLFGKSSQMAFLLVLHESIEILKFWLIGNVVLQ